MYTLIKKFVKLFVCSFLIFVAVSGLVIQSAYAQNFDCSNLADGNYSDPDDCTKFISCSNGSAYEQDCDACNVSEGLERCPEGKLVYFPPTDSCQWAYLGEEAFLQINTHQWGPTEDQPRIKELTANNVCRHYLDKFR